MFRANPSPSNFTYLFSQQEMHNNHYTQIVKAFKNTKNTKYTKHQKSQHAEKHKTPVEAGFSKYGLWV